jgi:uncharacterized protein YndB with AHSA1/START domain
MEQATRQKPSLSLSRHYPVAPEKVWRAWTDPQAVSNWWGPGPGEPVSATELDVRVGGRFRIVFGGADGTELDFRHEQFFDEQARDSHKRGWAGLLDKLDGYLRSLPAVEKSRA